MVRATEAGDIAKTQELLSRLPLLDDWVPYNAQCWSQLAAAAGQLDLMDFWRDRETQTRSARLRASPESLLFWAMGSEHIECAKGNPRRVAEKLLNEGANIEGGLKGLKDYSPLHRAVFNNCPQLVQLLIRRGASLSRRYVTGESALQIALRIQAAQCAAMLQKAGAPLELPKKPERPKPVRTVDLRAAAEKLKARIESSVRRFARQHRRETVTAVALASIPHEGYVMIAFDTHPFEGNPWDATYTEYAYANFPDWKRAHEGESMRLIDADGRTREGDPDFFLPRFQQMIVAALKSVEQRGGFNALNTAKGCQIGIEMTAAGEGKFWRLRKHNASSRADSR